MSELQPSQLTKPDALLTTKFTVPRLRAPLVARSSLLARLDEGLDRKLTLLSAPAGFGKTTLVSQWFTVQQHDPNAWPRAWVALDAGDNDPVRFWRYLFRACQAFAPHLGESALVLLNAPQPAFEAALTLFINELAQLPNRHILVLEDYHFIASPQIHEMILFLLDHLPDTLHLVMLTRHDPPLPLARLRTRHELNEIGAAELRFSLAETQAILQQSLPVPLSPETVARLNERTEGWVAALRLVVLALHNRERPAEIEEFITHFSGGHGHILEYLVEEVLHAQPKTVQNFLLQTTFLSRLSTSLCNAVTERTDSGMLLAQMERANLFLTSLDGAPLDNAPQWYRYHGLFAEAMNHYARHHLAQAERMALYARASLWYEAHGLLGEALETALATHAYVRAANLLEQIVAPQLVQNQFHTLRRWIEQLPDEVMRLHPQLCMTLGVAILFTSDRYAPQTHALLDSPLRTAEELWRAEGNQRKLGELLAFQSLVSWFQNNLPQAIAQARESLTLLPADDAQWRGISLLFMGLEAQFNGHLDIARQELVQGLEFNRQARNTYGIIDTLLLLGRVCSEQGELRQAAHYIELALADAEHKPMTRQAAHLRKGRALLGLAALEFARNRLETAEHYAAQAVVIAQTCDEEEWTIEANVLLAQTLLAQGQTTQAQSHLHALMAQTKQPHLTRQVQGAQVRMALALGDLATARRLSLPPAPQPLPFIQEEAELLLEARLRLAEGKHDTVLSLLKGKVNDALAHGRIINAVEMLILTALAANESKHFAQAKVALQQAVELAQAENVQRPFLDAGELMAEMLRSLLRETREEAQVAYLRHLLLALAEQKVPTESLPTVDAALLVEPLSTQERRVLRLLAAHLSNPEIADELVVSLNTVKTHVKNIYSKLNVHNRDEAAELARQLHLI